MARRPATRIYQDTAGDWRWTMQADNGEVIGASTEGYESRADCEANLAAVMDADE